MCNVELKNETKAERYFELTMKYSPSNELAIMDYAQFLLNQSRYDEAQELLLRVLEVQPNVSRAKSLYQKAGEGNF